ncbi:hypothetical protein [Streptomyces sp. NPDC006335]|uniref:hypothetical protein n=1 Tax=Streptomyces sp. NPDC006335 TaxID=3156895 RepID=UPI0033B35C84
MVVWILWAILMSGGGLTAAIFCTVLVAPGAVFYLVSNAQAKRRARTREVGVSAVSTLPGAEMLSSGR